MILALSIVAGLAVLTVVWRFVRMEKWLRRMARSVKDERTDYQLRRELRRKTLSCAAFEPQGQTQTQTPNQERKLCRK